MKKQMATKINYVSPNARQANGPMATKVEKSDFKPIHYVMAIGVLILITIAPSLDNIQF